MTAPQAETLAYVAPFGLGLWDAATARLVAEGLVVRVHAVAGTRLVEPRAAVANAHGIFVARDLRGLRAFETGAGDAEFWQVPHPARPFLVEVRDRSSRFIPFALRLALPARGTVLPPCAAEMWPPAPPGAPAPRYVPLFSAPSRTVPSGLTAVRASLAEAETRRPAAYAVLEVRESAQLLARGVADEQGQVAAVFAYPEPRLPPPASPPGSAGALPLAKQTWTLDIVVRYRTDLPRYRTVPWSKTRTLSALRDGAPETLPDLCDVLGQPAAAATFGAAAGPFTGDTLAYGEELVLGGPAGAKTLLISPA